VGGGGAHEQRREALGRFQEREVGGAGRDGPPRRRGRAARAPGVPQQLARLRPTPTAAAAVCLFFIFIFHLSGENVERQFTKENII
jgi:hypothetical protein